MVAESILVGRDEVTLSAPYRETHLSWREASLQICEAPPKHFWDMQFLTTGKAVCLNFGRANHKLSRIKQISFRQNPLLLMICMAYLPYREFVGQAAPLPLQFRHPWGQVWRKNNEMMTHYPFVFLFSVTDASSFISNVHARPAWMLRWLLYWLGIIEHTYVMPRTSHVPFFMLDQRNTSLMTL